MKWHLKGIYVISLSMEILSKNIKESQFSNVFSLDKIKVIL